MTSPTSSDTRYQVGQRWRCQGRSADEQPVLLINDISSHPRGGLIYHISLEGLKIRNPRTPGVLLERMAYLPVAVQTLDHSGMALLDTQPVNPAYRQGRQWQVAKLVHQLPRSLAMGALQCKAKQGAVFIGPASQ